MVHGINFSSGYILWPGQQIDQESKVSQQQCEWDWDSDALCLHIKPHHKHWLCISFFFLFFFFGSLAQCINSLFNNSTIFILIAAWCFFPVGMFCVDALSECPTWLFFLCISILHVHVTIPEGSSECKPEGARVKWFAPRSIDCSYFNFQPLAHVPWQQGFDTHVRFSRTQS